MAQNNIVDIALNAYIKALKVDPHNKDAYLDAGVLLGNLGKYDEAIQIWKLGLRIDPSDHRFKDNIAGAIKLESK